MKEAAIRTLNALINSSPEHAAAVCDDTLLQLLVALLSVPVSLGPHAATNNTRMPCSHPPKIDMRYVRLPPLAADPPTPAPPAPLHSQPSPTHSLAAPMHARTHTHAPTRTHTPATHARNTRPQGSPHTLTRALVICLSHVAAGGQALAEALLRHKVLDPFTAMVRGANTPPDIKAAALNALAQVCRHHEELANQVANQVKGEGGEQNRTGGWKGVRGQ